MLKQCPHCQISWQSPNTIPEDLLKANGDYYKSLEEATIAADGYGWTKENDKRFGINVCGIELDRDRVEYWECTACNTVFDHAYNKTNKESFLKKNINL